MSMIRISARPLSRAPRRAPRAALALSVTALVTATACRFGPGRVCTLIGSDSGVSVGWDPAAYPDGALFRLCADGECRERESLREFPFGSLQVRMPEEDGPREVAVSLSVTDPARGGRVVHDGAARVTLRKVTPNGEGCGPVVWQAAVRADPRDGLTPAAV
ncbi:hypothetical protein ACFFTQ_00915 [Streptomyces roseofulvus]|uniref:hypothetical protein n=1 Tax=Streptomyces roseofulvus TaxID=33902 RepID=UPI0031FDDE76